MFADSLSDSAWFTHRGWTTLISFALQALAVGCLLFLPLLYTEGLPRLALLAPLLAPAPPPAAPPIHLHPNANPIALSNLMGDRLIAPRQIPPAVSMVTETTPPPPMVDPNAIGADRGVGDLRGRGTVLDSILGANQILVSPPPGVHHPPMSHMMEGNLVYRVQPDYPALARQVRVQGRVVLRAMISREGSIENLQVLSGHPMLVQAAVDAVRQWRYRPYVLNGEPVEVETEVTVKFVLSGG
ncbi:MAG: energy transducer TonB [Terriglobales bacterium]